MQHGIRQVLEGHTLVPVVTFHQVSEVPAFIDFLLEQKVRCIEITLRTEAGMAAIEKVKEAYGERMLVGAGTVITSKQVETLRSIGADFMVSPGLTESLLHAFEDSETPYLPGAATPSEVMWAQEQGLDTLKFFPANLYGGLDALKAYGQLFPGIGFCPTGGITKETSTEYLSLSNVFTVGGSWFQKEFSRG